MNPNYVCSLELSKQLKESGWKKETEFVWVNAWQPYRFKVNPLDWVIAHSTNSNGRKIFPAPLATEILEELPIDIEGKLLTIIKGNSIYDVDYGTCWNSKQGDTLSSSLAKMWLFLKKEGLS